MGMSYSVIDEGDRRLGRGNLNDFKKRFYSND